VHPAEAAELAAFRDMLLVASGGEAVEVGGALCTAARALPDSTLVNRALGLGEDAPAGEDALDEVGAFFHERGVRHCVTVTPHARPHELRAWLGGRGYERGYAWAKFLRAPGDPPPARTELEVRLAGPAEAEDFARVFVGGYGLPAELASWFEPLPARPGWSCYVAYADGEPAATGALLVTGRVGWLGAAATLPEHRRKGGQGAILAARLRRAAELGCEVVATETGALEEGRPANSYRNILRSGFELAYVRENWIASAEPPPASAIAVR
jgi:GNAT superfamily N-acetyltransferase